MDYVPSHAWGINGPIRDNFVVHGDEIIFPTASHIVAFDPESKATRFFDQPNGNANIGPITGITSTPNEKYIAVAYRATIGDGAQVIIYRTSNRKQIACLLHRSRVTSLCFSGDSKQLICAAEDSLNIWAWESEKLDFSAALSGNITRVSCPSVQFSANTLLVSSTGSGFCRLWIASTRHRLTNSMITRTETKEQKYNFKDHVWLTNGDNDHQNLLLAIVTEPLAKSNTTNSSGVISEETVVSIYKVVGGISSSRPRVEHDQSIPTDLRKNVQITTIAAFRSSPGFALGGTQGTVLLYEYRDDCDSDLNFFNSKRLARQSNGAVTSIQNRNIHEDKLLISCENNRISELEILNGSLVEIISDAGHVGGIDDIDCSIERPYIVSCGRDKTLRIWDFKRNDCIISHQNGIDEPLAVAIHPTGYQVAVGYKDKLIMYHILVDSLKAYREMQCKSAVKKVAFSDGGQYLAVVCGSKISVYSTYQSTPSSTFLLLTSFTGHVGPIMNLRWGNDTLFSAGADRNIYGWNMTSGTRVDNFNVLRSFGVCSSIAVAASHVSFIAAACTSDGALHTLVWSGRVTEESKVRTICRPNDTFTTTVCLSEEKTHIFAGTNKGSIRIYDFRSPESGEESRCIQEISLHCSSLSKCDNNAISCLISSRNQIISAGGIDGALLLSSLKSAQMARRNTVAPILDDQNVLIGQDDYEETKAVITELHERMKTLKSDHEYDIHSKESLWKNELIELSTRSDSIVEAERQRYTELQTKHEETIKSHLVDLVNRDKTQKSKLEELQDSHEQRIKEEQHRYETLYAEMNANQESNKKLLEAKTSACNKQIHEIQQAANSEVKLLKTQVHKMQEEITDSRKVFEEILNQQEEEYEMELLRLKAASEGKLQTEQMKSQNIREEVRSQNVKKSQLMRQNEELRCKASFSEDTFLRESTLRRKLQSDIDDMHSQVEKFEAIIEAKNADIKILSNRNKSLTTLKSLLENQISDLESEKAPLKARTEKIQNELSALSTKLSEEKEILKAKEFEHSRNQCKLKNQERQMKKMEGEIRVMKREFVILAGLEGEQEIKAEIDMAYKKYGIGEELTRK